MKQISRITIAVLTIILIGACNNYYKAIKPGISNVNKKATTIDSLNSANRYFILRSGSRSYAMENVVLSDDHTKLDCFLDSVSYLHTFYINNGNNGKEKYKKSKVEESNILNEVHFYITYDSTAVNGKYTLELNKIQKIEIIEKDKKRTTNSYVIGTIGVTLGTFVLAAIIVAATKSSCPFVSAYDGNEFSLQGEIYGGAIYPQLARHDYMPLKMDALNDGSLQVKISNELKEHQYTDIAELFVITHSKKSKVFADETGNLYAITDPQTPVIARLNENKIVTASLQKAGDNAMLYMDDTSIASATNELQMHFNKPVEAKNAKLLLCLKNSYFLDLLYGEMAKGFGTYYGRFIKKQERKPITQLAQWMKDQQIPLQVSVKTGSGWKKITDITTIGPLATRNIVIPIELPETNEAFTDIRLESGFMFWEIDYAALDFSEENNFTVQKLSPAKATDETGKNVISELLKEDAVYLSQPDIGNIATIEYRTDVAGDDSKARSYILHTKGYYEHVRNFSNKPDAAFLNQFKRPGGFPLFGLNYYKKMNAENLKTMARSN